MKKNYFMFLSFLTILCLGLNFSSCSDDDDEDKEGGSAFAVNGSKQEVLNGFFESSSSQYCLGALFGNDMLSPSQFEIYYNKTNLDITTLKVGDELPVPQKIAYWVKFTTGTLETGSSIYEAGTITITSVDVSNRTITVRFNNIKIKHNYENTTFTLNGDLEIENAKW